MDFLKTCPAQRFVHELLSAISWETGLGSVNTVKEAVRSRLHAYGGRFNLLPRDADLALAPLFEHVVNTAFRSKRALLQEDFRIQFDHATRQLVPRHQFSSLLAKMAAAENPAETVILADSGGALTEVLQGGLPPLPEPCCLRERLVEQNLATLKRSQLLVLSGTPAPEKARRRIW